MTDIEKVTQETQKKIDDSISSKTVMYILYILYKSNIITRYNLNRIFKEIKAELPEDITKYLVEEEAKKS